jgi:hypothetical protein
MSERTCNVCEQQFSTKQRLDSHLKKKSKCTPKNDVMVDSKCYNCGITLSSKYTLARHLASTGTDCYKKRTSGNISEKQNGEVEMSSNIFNDESKNDNINVPLGIDLQSEDNVAFDDKKSNTDFLQYDIIPRGDIQMNDALVNHSIFVDGNIFDDSVNSVIQFNKVNNYSIDPIQQNKISETTFQHKNTLINDVPVKTVVLSIPVNNNVINNKTITNNVLFVKHGEESVEHMTREILLEILAKPTFIAFFENLVTSIYFNENVIQNINWFIAFPKISDGAVTFNHQISQFQRSSTKDTIDAKFYNIVNKLLYKLMDNIFKEDMYTKFLTPCQRHNLNKFNEYVFKYLSKEKLSSEAELILDSIRKLAFNSQGVARKSFREQGLSAKHLSLKF